MVNATRQRPEEESAQWAVVRRQAVFDGQERVAGYELLLDAHERAGAAVATACAEIGLRRIVGGHRVFVGGPLQLLSQLDRLRLPAEQVIVQIPRHPVEEETLAMVGGLVEHGFGVSVGGWALESDGEPVLKLASAVKIDFDFGTRELARLVARRAELHARGLTLIAANVQTPGEYEQCRRLGFDAFQGRYLAVPDHITGRRTPTFRAAMLARVLEAGGPEAFDELERLIAQDAGLTHRFLQVAGSAFYGARARVRSVRHALARLGADAVRRWLVILLVAGLSDSDPNTPAGHLLGLGLHRARLCQLLARERSSAMPDVAFTAGLLSVLPALVNRPAGELFHELSLHHRLSDALLDYRGPAGRLLAAVLAYENGERENVDGEPPLLAAITRIYAQALLWTQDTAAQLG